MRNRSLKSELTNIASLHFHGMDNYFPHGVEARLGRLRLPEFQVERPVHFLQLAFAFCEIRSHGFFISQLFVKSAENLVTQTRW